MRLIDGWWWPDKDKECHKVIPGEVGDVERALSHVEFPKVAIQAGGNVGIWAKYLSERFDVVYTFEPDPENFECLSRNLEGVPNVYKFQCALGFDRDPVGLKTEEENCGAHFVEGRGNIPVLRIDDLRLDRLDFVCLDVEGMEFWALRGGLVTIKKFHPVLMYEDKGHSERYGIEKGHIEKTMTGYSVVARIHRDVILA